MTNYIIMRLSELKVGENASVTEVNGEKRLRRRLFDMGITPTCRIYIKKKAPFNDPIEISLRGYDLSLRKKEADLVLVEKIVRK